MSTLSSASTIEDGDRIITVIVSLAVEVNIDAYRREYDEDVRVADIRQDVRDQVLGAVEMGPYNRGFMPEGIIHEVELR